MLRTIRDLPEALTGTGWSLAPTTRLEWFQYFASLKHLPIPFIALQGDVHLFTDGSCHNQMFPNRRFAGWAVVLASVASVHDCAASTVVDAGVLPGLLQSAIRAEIYAIWRALQIARNHCGLVHLWSDCKAVVNKVRRLLGRQTLKPNSVHADLWCEFQQCLQDRQGPTMITQVAAHQDADAVDHVVSEWCYRHNALADSAAGRANFTRPATFWHLHGRHEQASAAIHELNRTVQYVQLAISQEIVRNENPSLPAESLVTEVPLPAPVWKPLPELAVPQGAVRWYGDSMVRLVLSRFWQTLHGSQAPVVWVSRFQLYADFMSSTGHPGPIHRDKWIDGATEPHLSLQAFAYKQRTRWFVKLLKESLRHQDVSLVTAYGKPCSQMLLMFTGIIALPWPAERLQYIDQWMLKCSGTTYRRQSKLLDSLPFIDYDDRFPQVAITTSGF